MMSEKERRVTAYHEMGHALVAHYLDNTDPVHGLGDLGGRALGYTISLPTEDKFDHARGAVGHDGDDAGRPRRRGDRLQRGHHRRLQ